MNFPEFHSPYWYPTVFFGVYTIPDATKPNDIYIKHPIEWLVVEKDHRAGKALLVAKHCVDWNGFANSPILDSGYKTSWETSFLRSWLNKDFYEECFSSQEKNAILCGENRECPDDKMFLLSEEEVQKCFYDEDMAIGLIPMTDYDGKHEDRFIVNYSPVLWWTRTSGEAACDVVCVDRDGSLCEMDSNCDEIGVRPAMWVKL